MLAISIVLIGSILLFLLGLVMFLEGDRELGLGFRNAAIFIPMIYAFLVLMASFDTCM